MRSYRPMKRVGPKAFLPPSKPLPPGPCTWCGRWMLKLDRDHVLPRDLFPGAHRDDPPNLVPACRRCNRARADGKRNKTFPSFARLPKKSQAFALAWFTRPRLERLFVDVPTEADVA